MTAQNMGKKILTDAGYEVVAVSNGAAAVKKIKEQKPDIIILDIYMPGYTGLEVCDKVRSSTDTLRTPVLLTVGKMEPYRPEDANRVRADGVIIKPFEASDLLAVVKKLEERVVRKSAPVGEETILLERPPDFTEFEVPAPENHNEVHARQTTVQSTVDVPDNMATTAAFSDLLGTDSGHSLEPLPLPSGAFSTEVQVPPTAPEPAMPPVEQVTPAAAAAEETAELYPLQPAEKAEPAAVSVEPSFAAAIPDTEPTPAYREPEVSAAPEVNKTVVQASAEIEVAAAQAKPLETGAFIDPGLAIHVASFDPFTAKVDSEVEKIEAIVSASEARHADVEPAVPSQNGFAPGAAKEVSSADAEFEARVAAAMAIYDQPVEEKAQAADVTTKIVRQPELPEPTPSFEYSPPVNAPAAEIPVESSAAEKTEPAAEATPALETVQPVSDAPAVAEPLAEAPQPAEEAPISVGPTLVTREVTQVIPVYLEPAAEPAQAPAVTEKPISAAPTFVSMEATQVIPVYLEPAAEPVQAEPAPAVDVPAEVPPEIQTVEEKVAAEVKAELPNLPEDATGMDTMMISAVADRILDRLKPQLIEEIARELKKKK